MRRMLPDNKVTRATLFLLFLILGHAASASNITIDFNGISGSDGSPFTSYMESGFTVSAVTNQWLVAQSGGNPGPFIYFLAQPSDVITAAIEVTDGGMPFKFDSIDLYSSITPIPYTFVGLLNNNVVFTVSGTVPNTFGNFATVLNPDANFTIDTLEVSLTNSFARALLQQSDGPRQHCSDYECSDTRTSKSGFGAHGHGWVWPFNVEEKASVNSLVIRGEVCRSVRSPDCGQVFGNSTAICCGALSRNTNELSD
jgi:hypothetical protein